MDAQSSEDYLNADIVFGSDDPQQDREGDHRSVRCTNGNELLESCDVLWGCSGADFFAALDSRRALGHKTLISCSSSDREFRTALRDLNNQPDYDRLSRLATVEFQRDNAVIQVRRGGFPINFDGSMQSVPARDIQLTRGLLYAGVMQAAARDALPAAVFMLSPASQRTAVEAWRESRRDADSFWEYANARPVSG